MLDKLRELGIRESLINDIDNFRKSYPVDEKYADRIPTPQQFYYGRDVWEQAVAAILCGQNLLLVGHKATGKNLFAENLAGVFGRPRWDVSFHVNMDAASLIGMDTFRGGEVTFRPGPVYTAAKAGGFTVLDEINMAKSEAMAVLHATLDFRRTIDVPGYDRIILHPGTRFIGTMNYGYAGTRELNEALVSRFLVIDMPALTKENLYRIIRYDYAKIKEEALDAFGGLFLDLQEKADNSEISTKCMDLRGLLSALGAVKIGLTPWQAVQMGIINKAFDIFEREIVSDMAMTRIPEDWTRENVF